ncbi:MAG: slipin family protein [Vampirovibrio sp.]|nr:slipin family protein [Vampirovibrio sp.]
MEWFIITLVLLCLIAIGTYVFSQWIRVINQYQRGIVFRFGKVARSCLEPGLHILLFPPIVDKLVTVDMRTVTLEVPPQDVITKDSIMVRVSAVIYYKVIDPVQAVVLVENYGYATSQAAQSVLRSVVGQFELEDFLGGRDNVRQRLHALLDAHTNPWGVHVNDVDIKDVELSEAMQRSLARKAEAEQEQLATLIGSEAELQAAENLCRTAQLMEQHPIALQLRYLQTAQALGHEKAHTLIFPFPMDLGAMVKPLVSAIQEHLPVGGGATTVVPDPILLTEEVRQSVEAAQAVGISQPVVPVVAGASSATATAGVQLPFAESLNSSSL